MKKSFLKSLPKTAAVLSIAALAASVSQAQIIPFSEDYEGLPVADGGTDLTTLGWNIGANVYDGAAPFPGNQKFFYGLFGAPNGGPGFSSVATGDATNGGVGVNYLNIYSDYNCCGLDGATPEGHGNGTDIVNALVLKEYSITAADIGSQIVFTYDVKRPDFLDDGFGGDTSAAVGNGCGAVGDECTASAFVKTLDPSNSFITTNEIVEDSTAVSQSAWETKSITLDITDPLLEGQILQVGFQSFAGDFNNTGAYYDNVSMVVNDIGGPAVSVPVPAIALAILAGILGGVVAVRRSAIK